MAGAILTALLPPLILGTIIDTMTTGNVVSFYLILAYFGFTLLMGHWKVQREGLLIVFGQKITHALRSSLMDKYTDLTADALTHQEPGSVVSRFVGDVDTVENLFTSGIISMFSDACKIVSILAVIWFRNKGLAIVLFVVAAVSVLVYAHRAEKYADRADRKPPCCQPCPGPCSADASQHQNDPESRQRKLYGRAL